MFRHYKFQKISDKVNSYQIDKKNKRIFSRKVDWVVTEKVHGSNFSIYYHNGHVSFSKRNNTLEKDEWFYNYQLIKSNLIKSVSKLSAIMNQPNIVVYGELFGGWYPDEHKCHQWTGADNIRINQKGICIVPFEDRAIQEGIYYSPNIEYMVFDIAIIENDKLQFIDFFKMEEYLKQTNFFYSKPLMIGSFQDVQKYNINFDSQIPSQLGLSQLPKNTNIAEGIVIKPVSPYFIKDKKDNLVRCLIKIKNKKFQEISDDFVLKEAQKSYKFLFLKLVNQNRFQAVMSKIGKLTEENKNEVVQSLVEDVWTDVYTHYSHVQIKDETKAGQYLNNLCLSLVSDNYY